MVLVAEGRAAKVLLDGFCFGRGAVFVLFERSFFFNIGKRVSFWWAPVFLVFSFRDAAASRHGKRRAKEKAPPSEEPLSFLVRKEEEERKEVEKRSGRWKFQKKNQLTVPHTKSVTSPLSLENLANASADSTQPMMLPRWGTLLTYGSAEVMRTFLRPGRGRGAGAESSASRVAEGGEAALACAALALALGGLDGFRELRAARDDLLEVESWPGGSPAPLRGSRVHATATSASDGAAPPPRRGPPAGRARLEAGQRLGQRGLAVLPAALPLRAAATAGRSVVSSHSSQFSWSAPAGRGPRPGRGRL